MEIRINKIRYVFFEHSSHGDGPMFLSKNDTESVGWGSFEAGRSRSICRGEVMYVKQETIQNHQK